MTKKLKKRLQRIIIAAVLFFTGLLMPDIVPYLNEALLVAAYVLVGYDVILKAVRNIKRGKVFDENFLMTIATFGAFGLRDFDEAVAVMLFYQVGEFFQTYAINRSRKSISDLMDIRPDYANIQENSELLQVDPEEVAVGSVIVVQPGERVPLDGIVLTGTSTLNTAALTGESLPQDVAPGDEIISGCINLTGLLTVQTT